MANAQIQVAFLENGRGGNYLLHAGYKFSVKSRQAQREICYWDCVIRDCPARVTTLDNIPVAFKRDHNHASDHIGQAESVFLNDVKKRCREEVVPIPTIYDEELGKLRDRECDDDVEDMIRKIPTFESCRQSLYNNRSKLMPKLPTTQTPGLFTQLYSFHAKVDETYFPLVYALLPNKTEDTYRRLFTMLRDATQQRNLVLTPETVMLDFEAAARNAIHSLHYIMFYLKLHYI
jgi:hypothetical protein